MEIKMDLIFVAKFVQPKDYPKLEKFLKEVVDPDKSSYTHEEADLLFDENRDKLAQILGYANFMEWHKKCKI